MSRTWIQDQRPAVHGAACQALQFELTPMPPGGSPHYFFGEENGRLLQWQYATDPDAWR
jgi:hypothetical protein